MQKICQTSFLFFTLTTKLNGINKIYPQHNIECETILLRKLFSNLVFFIVLWFTGWCVQYGFFCYYGFLTTSLLTLYIVWYYRKKIYEKSHFFFNWRDQRHSNSISETILVIVNGFIISNVIIIQKFKIVKNKKCGHLLALFLYCAKQMVNDQDHNTVTMCFQRCFWMCILTMSHRNVIIFNNSNQNECKGPMNYHWTYLVQSESAKLFIVYLNFTAEFLRIVKRLASRYCWFGHLNWIKTIRWILRTKC